MYHIWHISLYILRIILYTVALGRALSRQAVSSPQTDPDLYCGDCFIVEKKQHDWKTVPFFYFEVQTRITAVKEKSEATKSFDLRYVGTTLDGGSGKCFLVLVFKTNLFSTPTWPPLHNIRLRKCVSLWCVCSNESWEMLMNNLLQALHLPCLEKLLNSLLHAMTRFQITYS